MPSGRIDQSLYLGPFANVEAMNTSTLYKPGELGSQIQLGGKAYQLVQLDSGATSAVATGAPVAGHLAFWKSRANYIVTNNPLQAENYVGGTAGAVLNSVAGVFCPTTTGGAAGSATITPGNYGVIQQRGTHVGVFTDGTASTAGQWLQPDTAGSTDKVDAVALGTAPAYTPVGKSTAATSAVTTGYTPAILGGWDLVDVP